LARCERRARLHRPRSAANRRWVERSSSCSSSRRASAQRCGGGAASRASGSAGAAAGRRRGGGPRAARCERSRLPLGGHGGVAARSRASAGGGRGGGGPVREPIRRRAGEKTLVHIIRKASFLPSLPSLLFAPPFDLPRADPLHDPSRPLCSTSRAAPSSAQQPRPP
jgi:hypothetical protein